MFNQSSIKIDWNQGVNWKWSKYLIYVVKLQEPGVEKDGWSSIIIFSSEKNSWSCSMLMNDWKGSVLMLQTEFSWDKASWNKNSFEAEVWLSHVICVFNYVFQEYKLKIVNNIVLLLT